MATATFAAPNVADACGGCFHQSAGGVAENTVVTGHRMAMAISQTQSVLWDQIEYSGDPSEFSWVLPVKPGAHLEVAQDAFFDVLDAGTQTAVGSKAVSCSSGGGSGSSGGFGCGSSDMSASADSGRFAGGESDPVTVVSQSTVGPYETVTLSTEQPGALNEWLDSHGYVVPEAIQPTVDAYVSEGFDFIALRLVPGNGVHQMQPVRVIMPGGQMTLPLRLVAAGTGAQTAINLFVIGEGRYEVQNFPNLLIDQQEVIWDYASSSSNYTELRAETLGQQSGLGWLTSYAREDTLLSSTSDGASELEQTLTYNLGGTVQSQSQGPTTLAEAYLRAAGGSSATTCLNAYRDAVQQGLSVVANCDEEGICAPLEPGEISADDLVCEDGVDDLAVALTGMKASDIWITRLEAQLPRAAFEQDLVLQATTDQTEVNSRFMAGMYENNPCGPSVSSASLGGGETKESRRIPGGIVVLTIGAVGLALFLRRQRDLPDLG